MRGGSSMWSGGLWMILFWIVVVVLAIWAVRVLFGSVAQQPQKSTRFSLGIAKTRYARGEISQEEYFTLLEDFTEDQ